MDINRKQFESDLKQDMMDRQLNQLHNEWESRKQDMICARKEIDSRERKRLERLDIYFISWRSSSQLLLCLMTIQIAKKHECYWNEKARTGV